MFKEDCINCHKLHKPEGEPLLKENIPDLCFECHKEMEEFIKNKKIKHFPIEEGKKCLNCHSAHASNFPNHLISPSPKLCFSCHRKMNVINIPAKQNIETKMVFDKYVHPPAKESCSQCHNPHVSDNDYLLQEVFLDDSYVSGKIESVAQCFQCHKSEIIKSISGSGRTKFRNGDKNLHYLHFTKKKGRNCVSCHDVHSSNNQHLIADKILFGNWNMPLNFKISKTGGSCLPGCHKKKVYDRLKITKQLN